MGGSDHDHEREEAEVAALPAWPFVLALFVLFAMGLVFGLAARAARETTPDALDERARRWVVEHRDEWPVLTRFFRTVTRFGNTPLALPSALLVAVVLLGPREGPVARWRWREAGFWLAVLAGSWVLNRALKAVFRRERPPQAGWLVEEVTYSFPSNHSQFAAVFFSMLAMVLARRLPDRLAPLRALIFAACLTAAAVVAASRVWVGVHYVTDVVGGFAIGLCWVTAAWIIRLEWGRRGRLRDHRRAP